MIVLIAKSDNEENNRLAEHIWSKKFVVCHSFVQSVQMKFSYRHPLYIGKLMAKMTKRAEQNLQLITHT